MGAKTAAAKAGRKKRDTKQLWAFGFCLPNIVFFIIWFVIPAAIGLMYSFTNYNGFKKMDIKNLTISYNHQSTPVQVIYFIKNKIIFTKQFLLSSTFNSVLDYFKNNTKPESNIKLKDEYIYKNKTIDLNEPLINLIELKKN